MAEEMSEAEYAKYRQGLYSRNSRWSTWDGSITTFKTDKEEEQYQKWLKENKVNIDPNDPYPDYDMRGFYKALQEKDPKAMTAIDPHDKQLHYPDYWKTPFHETFSNESKWANPKTAPSWNKQDQLVTPQGQILFSPQNK